MRRIGIDELKQLQIEILNVVHEFCVENNINYFLDCGTLIGAIRHKGYIPWDDDIDVGMLRVEYEKFVRLFNTNVRNKRYKLLCVEIDDTYSYAFGKVIDTETVLYEPDKQGKKIAVNVDVFPYDNASNDNTKVKLHYKKRDFWRALNIAHSQRNDVEKGFLRALAFNTLHLLTIPFSKNYFARKMSNNAQRYNHSETGRVGNFTGYTVMICDKDVFSSYIDWEFERKKYKIPIGYDKWLKASYGDYMRIPPPEKRQSTHHFEAYYVNH